MRRPPNPLLQKRDEARAKGACPAAWAVRGFCKWDPEKYYDSPRPTCPSCEARLTYHGWAKPLLVAADLTDSYYLRGHRLKCRECEKKRQLENQAAVKTECDRTQYTFTNTDEPFLQQLARQGYDWVVMALPCVIFNKFAFDKKVVTMLRRGATTESISGVRQMLRELHTTAYYEQYEQYAAYEDWDRRNPNPFHASADENVRSRDFLEMLPQASRRGEEAYVDRVPSARCFRTAFIREVRRVQDFIKKRMVMIRGKRLKGDATFNVGGKCRAGDEKVIAKVFTIMNDVVAVEDQAAIFDDGDGCSELRSPGVSGMCANICAKYEASSSPPRGYYTDNCCNEVGQLVDHFPWLRGEYMNLKMPSLTFCGQTHVVTTEDGCRAACELFEKASVVGFDMEWWFATTSAGKQRPTALVQLATEDHAVLIQLSEFMSDSSSLPPALLQLMRSESVKKAGVGIDGDIKKLTRDFPSSKLFETASGIIDLSRLANERIIGPRCSRWGLASLCNAVLQKDLPKVQAIRLSNWEASPLSSQQVEYAALDAYAGVALYRKLIGPSPPLTEVGLMPTIDENDVSGDLDSVLDYDYDDVVAEERSSKKSTMGCCRRERTLLRSESSVRRPSLTTASRNHSVGLATRG